MALRRFAIPVFISAFLTFSTTCPAQKADASFVVGGAFASDDSRAPGTGQCTIPCPAVFTFKTSHHVFYEGNGAFRLANFKLVSLYLEVPVAGIPSAPVTFSGNQATFKVSTLFVTPSLRVKFAPGAPISPFASIGGGWAHFGGFGSSTNTGALQFGGGVDIRTGIPLLGFRAEVRDFVSGKPDFGIVSIQTIGSASFGAPRQNVLAGGGIVIRF